MSFLYIEVDSVDFDLKTHQMLEVFAEGNHIFRGYTKVADEVVEIL